MRHLNPLELGRMFICAGESLKAHEAELSAIDSRFGDGDHGVTMSKIAGLFLAAAPRAGEVSPKVFLEDLGTSVMAVSGGSAGPLWGTFIGGLALPLGDDESSIDASRLVSMLESALEEMKELSTARVGDKTMMDALIPAVEAARTALPGANVREVLLAAADGAEDGRKKTEQCIARYGRAKSYKEQTLGTPDAGATSMALVFRAFACF